MTGGAVGRLSVSRELAAVHVFVTSAARGGRIFEGDELGALADHRLMAFQAADGAMRAPQVELCLRVVEGRGFLPGADVVADFAVGLRVGGGIALVRIAMAFDAGHGTEVISLGGARRSQHRFGLMALAASRRQVAAQQLEARLLVASQSECGRPESIHRVALFALVRPGRPANWPACASLWQSRQAA